MPLFIELRDMEDANLTCKLLFSHAWEVNPHVELPNSDLARSSNQVLTLRCARCGRERIDYVSKAGFLQGRTYRNPTSYQHMHRLPVEQMRVEAMSRSILFRSFASNGEAVKPKRTRSRKTQ